MIGYLVFQLLADPALDAIPRLGPLHLLGACLRLSGVIRAYWGSYFGIVRAFGISFRVYQGLFEISLRGFQGFF